MKVYILQENFFEFVVNDCSDGHDDELERKRNIIGVFATMDDLLKRMAEEIMMARGEDFDIVGNDSMTGYEVSVGDTDTHDIENIGYYSYINELNEKLSTMKKVREIEDTERKHPIQRAAENASFDILGFIREKYKKAVTKHIKS
jgi:hypothetical protein